MSNKIDKRKIIAAINNTEDERILYAISQLLQLNKDNDIPDWHKRILNEREEKIKNGDEVFYDWEDIKEEIKSI